MAKLFGFDSYEVITDKLYEWIVSKINAIKVTIDSSLSSSSTNPVQNKTVTNALNNKVPTSRTINGKPLTENIELTASDVGADESGAATQALSDAKTYSDKNLATAKSYADSKVAAIINGAPETLNTIDEIAAALNDNPDVISTLNAAIGNKVSKVSGKGLSTNDLTDALKSNYDKAYTHSTAAHAPASAEKNVIVGIQKNGADLTPDSNRKVNVIVPTKVSELNNDSGYLTSGGSIAKANQLTTARNISINGGATAAAQAFNGTKDIALNVTALDAMKLIVNDGDELIFDGNF